MRPIILVLLVSVIAAAEGALFELACPDLGRTGERLAGGPYAALWQAPHLRRIAETSVAMVKAEGAIIEVLARAQELRVRLSLDPGDGEPQPVGRVALRVPEGTSLPALGDEMRRQGDWLLLGRKADWFDLFPALPGDAEADLRVACDLRAGADMLPAEERPTYLRCLDVVGLGRITAEAWAGPTGTRELVLLPGARLPLRPADPAALAGIPAQAQAVVAVGIDGPALAAAVRQLVVLAGGEKAWSNTADEFRHELGMDQEAVIAALDGTAVMALTPGVPFPGMTLSLPASENLDAMTVRALTALTDGDGGAQLAAARRAPVNVPLPGEVPLLLGLRRTATRWILSTDQALLLDLDRAAPFPADRVWPGSAGASALVRIDSAAMARTLAGFLPIAIAQQRDPRQRDYLTAAQQFLTVAGQHLPPAALTVHQDATGVRVEGRDAAAIDVAPLALVPAMVPAVILVRQQAQRSKVARNMRSIAITCIAYTNDFDEMWPNDLAEAQKWSEGDLTDEMLRSPGSPEIARPFLYVRPDRRAKSMQPILVQDPACNRGRGSMVCYADGHTAFVTGMGLWQEAKRLAVLPKASVRDKGIAFVDWQIDTATGRPKASPPAAPVP